MSKVREVNGKATETFLYQLKDVGIVWVSRIYTIIIFQIYS